MKLVVFLAICLFPFVLSAQIKFAGKDVSLYVGQILTPKVKPNLPKDQGYRGFTKKANTSSFHDNCPEIVYCHKYYYSNYDSLVNLSFLCTKVIPMEINPLKQHYLLQLYNAKTDTIYYRYNASSEYTFDLEVKGGITPKDGFYCKDIQLENDKFTSERIYRTPLLEPIAFEKRINKTLVQYYLILSTVGSTASKGQGVIILLENGEKLIKSIVQTTVRVNSNAKFVHSASILLTSTDISKLQKFKITDFRVYIYDETDIEGIKYRDYIKCLSKLN